MLITCLDYLVETCIADTEEEKHIENPYDAIAGTIMHKRDDKGIGEVTGAQNEFEQDIRQ